MNSFNLDWKRFLTLFLIIFFLLCLSWLKFLYLPVIHTTGGYRYTVKSGTAIRSVIDDLYDKKIVTNRFYFNLLVRLQTRPRDLKAGEYRFPKGSTPLTMLSQMVTGSGMIYHVFTIVPGWNYNELRAALLADPNLYHKLSRWSGKDLMNYLKHPEISPEGQFFPDTYYFSEGSSDIALLKRAYKAMQIKLADGWIKRPIDLPFKSPYEALIAASLIEKEAYLNTERPVIAGVLVNRLQSGMLLQFDPTVIYGTGLNYDGKIYKTDLTQDTPYNTYVHKGLPPTPIALPSLESIMAAMHPMKHKFIYFVARGDGSHQFSESLSEHNAAIALVKKMNNTAFFNETLVKRRWFQHHQP